MELPEALDIDELSSACLGRPGDALFSLDGRRQALFNETFRNRVVLITGAAGFIARATLEHVLKASPRVLYLLDASENGLTDLARDLAARRDQTEGIEIRLRFADVSTSLLASAIDRDFPVDVVLHFAAAKHVRSERDIASALRILAVNVLGTENLLHMLETRGSRQAQIFAISTDKAAEPTSMMGASKLIMESLLWRYPGKATSARFANVLFSSGSLTEGWLSRLGRRQPLSCPVGTFRYLLSRSEAGALCATATVAEAGSIAVPAADLLTPVRLEQLVERFLWVFQKKVRFVPLADYQSGRESLAWVTNGEEVEYPVVLTPLDTVGEKGQEVFSSSAEKPCRWTEELDLLHGSPLPGVDSLINDIRVWLQDPSEVTKLDEVRERLGEVLPTYESNSSGEMLDTRI